MSAPKPPSGAAASQVSNSSSSNNSNPLASGGAMTPHQVSEVVKRWRRRREEMERLTERLGELRGEQRADDARIRGFMERHERQEIPTSVAGPDGRPRQTGTVWLSNPRAVPKPLTKSHLAEIMGTYERVDEVTREHLLKYIWEQREFGPEVVSVNYDEYCEDGSVQPRNKRKRGGAADAEL